VLNAVKRINQQASIASDTPRASAYPTHSFTIVAVIDSSLENLQRHAQKHHSSFAILADQDIACFKLYEIEHSLPGMLKSMLVRLSALLDAMILKGYIPWRIKGSAVKN